MAYKLTALLLSGALLLMGASPVSATESSVSTIQQYSNELPKGSPIQTPQHGGEAITVGDLNVRLLIEHPESSAVKVNDNTVVYVDTDSATDTSVTAVETGGVATVETLTVIKDDPAPEKYGFALDLPDGTRLVKNEDETNCYDMIDSAGQVVGGVDAPWARDANGSDVPITLSLDRDVVVMSVPHKDRGFQYPIAADPLVTYGIATGTVYFNKMETKDLSSAGAAGLTCGLIAKYVKHPIASTVLTTGCVIHAVQIVMQASRAKNRGMCLKIKFTGLGGFWADIYRGKACK